MTVVSALLIVVTQGQADAASPVIESAQRAGMLRSVHLRGSAAQVVQGAFALYGLEAILVPPLESPGQSLQIDLNDASVVALAQVAGAMLHCFFVPVGKRIVLAVPDDGVHHTQFDRASNVTLTLPELPAKDSPDESVLEGLLRNIFAIDKASVHGESVTLVGQPLALAEAKATLEQLYRPPPQVLLDVKVYLVSRSQDRDVGVELPGSVKLFNVYTEAEGLISSNASVVTQLIQAGLVTAGDTLGIAELLIAGGYASNSVLGSSSLYFGGGDTATGVQFDAAKVNAERSLSTSQELQEVTLHVADGQQGTLRLGERYPVLTATTSALVASASTSTPSIEYEDLGLTLEVRPQVIARSQIVLHLHQTVRGLSGSSLNDIPILDNQEFSSVITVPAGATSVLTSNMSQSGVRATQGIIDAVPTDRSHDDSDAQLLITITPTMTRARAPGRSRD